MTSWARLTLEERVTRAAEAALADHHYVSALDIFVGMGLLAPAHVLDWRNGRIERAYRTYYVSPELFREEAGTTTGGPQRSSGDRGVLDAARLAVLAMLCRTPPWERSPGRE